MGASAQQKPIHKTTLSALPRDADQAQALLQNLGYESGQVYAVDLDRIAVVVNGEAKTFVFRASPNEKFVYIYEEPGWDVGEVA